MVCTKCGTSGADARPNWSDLGFLNGAVRLRRESLDDVG
jgi:hypothetical protein